MPGVLHYHQPFRRLKRVDLDTKIVKHEFTYAEFFRAAEELIEHECFIDERDQGKSDDETDEMKKDDVCLYSPIENLSSKDFSAFTDEDVERIKEEIARIVKKIATKRSRRKHLDPKGRELSLRHTLRKSMKYEGEIFEIARTRKS